MSQNTVNKFIFLNLNIHCQWIKFEIILAFLGILLNKNQEDCLLNSVLPGITSEMQKVSKVGCTAQVFD